MLVPASMAMVRVPCCGFEIFWFLALGFVFFLPFFFFHPFFVSLLPTILLVTFSFLYSETWISHILRWSFLAVPEGNKQIHVSLFPNVSHLHPQGSHTACSEPSQPGKIDLTISFFLWVLDCRDARFMQYWIWQLISQCLLLCIGRLHSSCSSTFETAPGWCGLSSQWFQYFQSSERCPQGWIADALLERVST